MLIREIDEKLNLDEIDLLDDLEFFMNNDSQFYRRTFYPVVTKIRSIIKTGKPCSDKVFRNCIDQAVPIYIKKFNIPGNEKSVFTDVDRDELAKKIFSKEKERIEKGEYDRSDQ
jgi:hypothetical protein